MNRWFKSLKDNERNPVAVISMYDIFFHMFISGIISVVIGYLLGSIPTAYLVSKYGYGIDIRTVGSGNVGGANALRTMGIKAGIIVVIVDVGKGTLAVVLAKILLSNQIVENLDLLGISFNGWLGLVGLSAVIGHCYPVWLKFRGGKGWATTMGFLLGIGPTPFLLVLVPWLFLVLISGFTSLSNILTVIMIPFALLVSPGDIQLVTMSLLLLPIIWWRHRENIVRLIEGRERRIWKREPIVKEEEKTENE